MTTSGTSVGGGVSGRVRYFNSAICFICEYSSGEARFVEREPTKRSKKPPFSITGVLSL